MTNESRMEYWTGLAHEKEKELKAIKGATKAEKDRISKLKAELEYIREAENLTVDGENFGMVMVCAMRYAMGRKTYTPGVVMAFVRNHIAWADENTKRTMIMDLDEHLTGYDRMMDKGKEPGRDGWYDLREWLKTK